MGTTAVTANGFLIVNVAGSAAATNQNAIAYQDSNGNGVIDSTDWASSFVVAGADTISFSVVGGQLAAAYLGLA